MVDFNQNIPFLWRLSTDNGDGFSIVSMVVPFNRGEESLEHTIETDVLSFCSDSLHAEEEETLEWNEDDISLFLKLIAKRLPERHLAPGETIRVDLNDPETIEIVQIVAAAGFGLVHPADHVLTDNLPAELMCPDAEPGSQVSLKTPVGYKRGIVVDVEEDDVICVMLDSFELTIDGDFGGEQVEICPHDLLLVKRHQVLHDLYTSESPTNLDILH